MAKFFKSIFTTSDRRKGSNEGEGDEERTDAPPMDGRRQLSISRSGKMKQANKKRQSLKLDLYGDDNLEGDKRKSMEYHVHGPINPTSPAIGNNDNRLSDFKAKDSSANADDNFEANLEKKLKALALDSGVRSPEEEIDNAFEIIDKS